MPLYKTDSNHDKKLRSFRAGGLPVIGQVSAQPDRWQQRVKYTMNVEMDVQTNRFTGTQTLAYTNNSPDTLDHVFYHLYWNAFQPGSMMDTRSRELGKITYNAGRRGGEQQDWDPRVQGPDPAPEAG